MVSARPELAGAAASSVLAGSASLQPNSAIAVVTDVSTALGRVERMESLVNLILDLAEAVDR